MRFLILGPLEVRGEDGPLALAGIKLRAVLAVLLLHANEPVSAERLALALWGDEAPGGAAKTVQVHIWRLRKALGDRELIATTPAGYCLRVEPDELDAAQFDRLVGDGTRALAGGQPDQAAALLREALSLWRGPALAELAGVPFAPAEIARLEEHRLAALETRVEADMAAGQHAELVAELRRLVAVHPTRELLSAQLMLALYRCGRQTDALEAYQDARRALVAHVGVEPGHRLRELQEAILRQDVALERSSGPSALPPAHAAASVSPLVGREDKPVALALPPSLRAVAGSAFVGRDTELARVYEYWTQVARGACSAVVIGGEPGIGKTRLASELAHAVHEQGALVLYGRCDEGLAVPLQPFVEALGPYARAVGMDRLRAELGHLAPELGRLWPELAGFGEPLRADPESERLALFEAVAALVEVMTREQRALLVLDDLHWAANPTLLLLRHLIRSERSFGALVLGTYRQTELAPGRPLAQLLADLQRDASIERLSIRGLDEPAIAALLQAAVEHPPSERAALVRVLADQTAGNPFFIRELLAHLAESGGRVTAGVAAAQLEAPEQLRHVIADRVARLSVPTGRALRAAAVAGPTFSFVLLERVLGERVAVLDAVEEAVAAGLLTDSEQGEYVFAHALVRQTIYQELGSSRRMRLHRQLGEALEALGRTEARVDALAHHFAQAAADGQGLKAAIYALAAGRNATDRLGYEEAAAHYQRGLDALNTAGHPHDERRCELLLALGQAHWHAGELDKARQAYGQATELADKLGDVTALARAALGLCGNCPELTAEVTVPIADLLQRALDAIGDDDSELRAQLMGHLAATLTYADVDRKPALARQALQMARRVADKATLADVLASTHRATRAPDTLHESVAMATELVGVADEVGDRRLQMLAHGWLLDHLLELGDIEAVERELEALQRLAHTRRERFFTWHVTTFRADHAHLGGRLDDCEALAHEALAHRYDGRDDLAAHMFGMQMLFVRREQGRLGEIVQKVTDVAAHYPKLVTWRCALAEIHAQLGHTAQARQELEALARDDFTDIPRDALWLSNVATLGEVVAFLGDTLRARRLYKLLMPYADRCVVTYALLSRGSASRPLGLLATTMSRYGDAARHFEHALEVNIKIKAPIWAARTQHDYARMLLERDRAGDNDRARTLLTGALATAERLGLETLVDRVRPLKLATEGAQQSLTLSKTA
jgi:DNA-binding SARP family transcriptional activator